MGIDPTIIAYNKALSAADKAIGNHLAKVIDATLKGADCKVWHRHPVWFIDGNPIVGYDKLKDSVRLMFWSGQSFDEPDLLPSPPDTRFKTAAIHYTDTAQINEKDLKRWLKKSVAIQWDYKNIVKRKGKLVRL